MAYRQQFLVEARDAEALARCYGFEHTADAFSIIRSLIDEHHDEIVSAVDDHVRQGRNTG